MMGRGARTEQEPDDEQRCPDSINAIRAIPACCEVGHVGMWAGSVRQGTVFEQHRWLWRRMDILCKSTKIGFSKSAGLLMPRSCTHI